MKLKIERKYKKDNYTIGNFYIDNELFCNTLEDKVRDLPNEKKVPGQTAIPSGNYEVVLSYSTKFKRLLPEILNVPYFTGIRIHRGNTKEDTEGCPLLGENKVKGKVINSTPYEIELIKRMQKAIEQGEKISIDIL